MRLRRERCAKGSRSTDTLSPKRLGGFAAPTYELAADRRWRDRPVASSERAENQARSRWIHARLSDWRRDERASVCAWSQGLFLSQWPRSAASARRGREGSPPLAGQRSSHVAESAAVDGLLQCRAADPRIPLNAGLRQILDVPADGTWSSRPERARCSTCHWFTPTIRIPRYSSRRDTTPESSRIRILLDP